MNASVGRKYDLCLALGCELAHLGGLTREQVWYLGARLMVLGSMLESA